PPAVAGAGQAVRSGWRQVRTWGDRFRYRRLLGGTGTDCDENSITDFVRTYHMIPFPNAAIADMPRLLDADTFFDYLAQGPEVFAPGCAGHSLLFEQWLRA